MAASLSASRRAAGCLLLTASVLVPAGSRAEPPPTPPPAPRPSPERVAAAREVLAVAFARRYPALPPLDAQGRPIRRRPRGFVRSLTRIAGNLLLFPAMLMTAFVGAELGVTDPFAVWDWWSVPQAPAAAPVYQPECGIFRARTSPQIRDSLAEMAAALAQVDPDAALASARAATDSATREHLVAEVIRAFGDSAQAELLAGRDESAAASYARLASLARGEAPPARAAAARAILLGALELDRRSPVLAARLGEPVPTLLSGVPASAPDASGAGVLWLAWTAIHDEKQLGKRAGRLRAPTRGGACLLAALQVADIQPEAARRLLARVPAGDEWRLLRDLVDRIVTQAERQRGTRVPVAVRLAADEIDIGSPDDLRPVLGLLGMTAVEAPELVESLLTEEATIRLLREVDAALTRPEATPAERDGLAAACAQLAATLPASGTEVFPGMKSMDAQSEAAVLWLSGRLRRPAEAGEARTTVMLTPRFRAYVLAPAPRPPREVTCLAALSALAQQDAEGAEALCLALTDLQLQARGRRALALAAGTRDVEAGLRLAKAGAGEPEYVRLQLAAAQRTLAVRLAERKDPRGLPLFRESFAQTSSSKTWARAADPPRPLAEAWAEQQLAERDLRAVTTVVARSGGGPPALGRIAEPGTDAYLWNRVFIWAATDLVTTNRNEAIALLTLARPVAPGESDDRGSVEDNARVRRCETERILGYALLDASFAATLAGELPDRDTRTLARVLLAGRLMDGDPVRAGELIAAARKDLPAIRDPRRRAYVEFCLARAYLGTPPGEAPMEPELAYWLVVPGPH